MLPQRQLSLFCLASFFGAPSRTLNPATLRGLVSHRLCVILFACCYVLPTSPLQSQTWQWQNSGTGNHLNGVHFTDNQNGWAVGISGTILKYSAGTIGVSSISTSTTRIGEISPQPVGINFNLNIFNPTDNQKATIGLFNAVGHVVFECSEILRADENTLTFPSESLPPGIYFLTVQVGTTKKTLRMVKQ